MRWTPVLWVLVSYAIFASSVTEAKRVERDLTTIKKFVMSNILGSNRRKCVSKSSRRKLTKGYEVFVVPERQSFILNPVVKNDKKELEASKNNDDSSFVNSLRSLLSGDIVQETYQGLKGIITMLQPEGVKRQEINSIIEGQPKRIQSISTDTIKLNLKSLPVVNDSKRTMYKYEMNYMRQPMSSLLPSIVSIVTPVITMPRKYSYEQTKGDIVEKFTLDKNFNVIVTRNPKVPRPEFVHDRVKDIILNMPLSGVKIANSYNEDEQHKNMLPKSILVPQLFKTGPNRNELKNGNYLYKRIINQDDFLVTNTNNIDDKQKPDGSENVSNNVLQQYIDRIRNIERYNNTSSLTRNQLDNNQVKLSPEYFYVPPNNFQGFTELPKHSEDVNKENIQTQYTYKQQTSNGFLQFNKSSNVTVDENGKIIVLNPPEDGNSVYMGKPIVVGSMDDTSQVTNNYFTSHNNELVKSKPNNDKLRGDI